MRSEQEANRAVERYADMVRRLCLVHLKNEADTEDVFQTVFLQYVLHDGAFESEEHEKAWLLRVTINACRDVLRSLFRARRAPSVRRLAPVFACLLVLLLGFAGYQAAFVPVAAIRVEINPAVELGVNRLGRVVSSSGLNEDGEALAEEENVWFLPYGEAIDRLLENSRVANCLAQGETVSIGVVTDDEASSLLAGVESCTAGQSGVACCAVGGEEARAGRGGRASPREVRRLRGNSGARPVLHRGGGRVDDDARAPGAAPFPHGGKRGGRRLRHGSGSAVRRRRGERVRERTRRGKRSRKRKRTRRLRKGIE